MSANAKPLPCLPDTAPYRKGSCHTEPLIPLLIQEYFHCRDIRSPLQAYRLSADICKPDPLPFREFSDQAVICYYMPLPLFHTACYFCLIKTRQRSWGIQ